MHRILVLNAGSAMGNNLIRSLQTGGSTLQVTGCNDSPFVLRKSLAPRNYVLPVSEERYCEALRNIIEAEEVDLLFPTSDYDVARIAQLRESLRCKTFLPSASTIERCQDKLAITELLRANGLPAPRTYAIEPGA